MFGLKPPQSIFVHGDGFFKAAISMNKNPSDSGFDPFCFAALVTNSAFASELYLKCLIHLESGQLIKDEHNLHKLFQKLSEKTQQEIEGPFNAELAKAATYDLSQASEQSKRVISSRPKTLREALKVGGKAFVEWRYLYEYGETGHFGLFPLPAILRNTILSRKPDWANFGFKLQRIGGVLPTSLAQKTPAQAAPADPKVDGNQ